MKRELRSSDDTIDPYDIQQRVEGLESERAELKDAVDDAEKQVAFAQLNEEDTEEATEALDIAEKELQEWDDDSGDHLRELQGIISEVGEETLIRDSNFVEYCEEMVKDIGDMPKEIPDYIVIDWDATAENLRADYSSTEFDGVTFWYRSV